MFATRFWHAKSSQFFETKACCNISADHAKRSTSAARKRNYWTRYQTVTCFKPWCFNYNTDSRKYLKSPPHPWEALFLSLQNQPTQLHHDWCRNPAAIPRTGRRPTKVIRKPASAPGESKRVQPIDSGTFRPQPEGSFYRILPFTLVLRQQLTLTFRCKIEETSKGYLNVYHSHRNQCLRWFRQQRHNVIKHASTQCNKMKGFCHSDTKIWFFKYKIGLTLAKVQNTRKKMEVKFTNIVIFSLGFKIFSLILQGLTLPPDSFVNKNIAKS